MSRRSARHTSGLRRAGRGSRSAARKRTHHRRLFFEPLEARRLLAQLTVGNLSDLVNGDVSTIAALVANPGADGISLREAIFAANAVLGQDEIQFSPTISSGGPARIVTSSELLISDSLTINGLGANLLTIDASGGDPTPGVNNNDGHRAFRIDSPTSSINVSIGGLAITGGESRGFDDFGAGIFSVENLTVRGVSIYGNRGRVGVDSGRGGAIANLQGVLSIDSSALFDNDAAVGGGIFNEGTMTIVNSTISGNRAAFVGGGISHGIGNVDISHSTITLNRAESSGGGAGILSNFGVQVSSSIIAGNIGSDDVRGNFISLGSNLIGGGPGTVAFAPSEVGFFDPRLAPLTTQGGRTPAHPLLPASPALDAGDPAALPGVGTVPFFDQRGDGFTRVRNGRIDIGSFEGVDNPLAIPQKFVVDKLVDEDDGDFSPGDLSLREAIARANVDSATFDTIEFSPNLTASGPATILLTLGELAITGTVTIDGPGANLLTIDASGNDATPNSSRFDGDGLNDGDGSRVFYIGGGPPDFGVAIDDLTLTGGDVNGDGGAILARGNLMLTDVAIMGNSATNGGGVSSSSSFAMRSTRVIDNEASTSGGGITTSRELQAFEIVISGNSAGSFGGGLYNSEVSGFVYLQSSAVADNIANRYGLGSGGGGIANILGHVEVFDSTISGNITESGPQVGNGGGILVVADNGDGSFYLVGTTLENNRASGSGGGAFNKGTLTIEQSTISANTAARDGGGLANSGSLLQVFDSTISGNSAAGNAGGIHHTGAGDLAVRWSTLTDNRSDSDANGTGTGGALYVETANSLTLDQTIVAKNLGGTGGPDVFIFQPLPILVLRYSLLGINTGTPWSAAPVGNADSSGNLIGTATSPIAPLLGPLEGNGGTTQTHTLLPGSPAFNAGNPDAAAGVGTVPEFDQRGNGFTRVFGGRIDIGALEGEFLNSDPVLSNPGDKNANEGANFNINGLFNFTDADSGDTHTAMVDWGDGSGVQPITVVPNSGGGTINGSHTYVDDGNYTLMVRVIDNQGGGDEQTIQVNVKNIPPTLIVASNQTALEDAPLNLTGSGPSSLGLFVDPGILDVHTATVNWGDGSPVESPAIIAAPGSGLLRASHTFANTGTYTVTVTVTDDSNESSTKTFTVEVVNVPPSIDTLSITSPVDEGQSATLTGTYSDANPSDTHELDIDWDGDGTYDETIAVTGGTFNATRPYADDNPTGTSSDTFNVNVRLRDNAANSDVDGVSLTVNNVAPLLVVATNQAVDVGKPLVFSTIANPLGVFVDLGTLDTHISSVNWGDSQSVETVGVAEQGGSGTLAATHGYSTPGTYQVTVTLRDDDGGERTSTFQVVALELPSLVVTTSQDVVANDGLTSLREAIAFANSTLAADTITFAAGLSGQRIELKGGELKIERSLTIDATAFAGGLTIDARGNDLTPGVVDGQGSRIFNIASADYMLELDVTIAGVTLMGGDVNNVGGAIYNAENLTLRRVVILGNSATRQGGGIASFGNLTIQESTLSGNIAGATTGGGGPVVNGSVATPRGGAVYSNYGTLEISHSTINGNAAEFGGGVFALDSDVRIASSTIGQNSAKIRGGGLWIENYDQSPARNVEIRHSTIYRNGSGLTGSGLFLSGPLNSIISHTLIAGVTPITGPADISFGTSTSPNIEYSLIGSTSGLSATDILALNDGTGNILNQAPLLGALANNGGVTQTYALLPGSPAASAGRAGAVAGENGVPQLDQRGTGFGRVRGLSIDIGAFETQNDAPAIGVPLAAGTSEGSEFDISTSVFFIDPDPADRHTVQVDWGDGTVENDVPIGGIVGPGFVLGKHTYRDNGPFQVTVSVDDGFNPTFRQFVVDVANVDPTASFDNNGPVSEGSSAIVSFTNSADAGAADQVAGLRYAYDFDNDGDFNDDEGDIGDGSYLGSATATSLVVPAALLADGPSSRTIRARVIDKNGGFTDYRTVVGVLNGDPLVDGGGPYSVDEGLKVRLNATAFDVPSDALTFAWDFDNDGLYDEANGAAPDFDAATIDGPATIIVRLRVTDSDGGVGFDTAMINVRNVPPIAVPGGPYQVDEGDSVTLQAVANDIGGDPLVYEWDFDNDGFYDDASGASPVFSAANMDGLLTFNVGLRVSDGDGGVGLSTTTIIVRNVPPQVDASGEYSVDEGRTVSLQASASDVAGDTLAYEWDFDGDGAYDDATGTTPSFSAANLDGPTTVTVGLRVSDGDGGSSPATFQINVTNRPPSPVPGGPYLAIRGGQVQLRASATDRGAEQLVFDWDFNGDGQYDDASNIDNPVYSVPASGGAREIDAGLRVRDDDGGEAIAMAVIQVVSPGGPFSVAEGGTTSLFATPPPALERLLSYDWDLNNNGQYFDPGDKTGSTVEFIAADLDGPQIATVRLRVSDIAGRRAVIDLPVEVRNVAPQLRFTPDKVDSSGRTVLNGTIDDPGKNEVFTVMINWGDGVEVVMQLSAGKKTFSAQHQYLTDGGSFLTPGVWPITVMVTDAVDQNEARGDAEDPPEPFIPFIPPPIIPQVKTADVPIVPFNPPTTAPEPPEQAEGGFEIPTSDGGAGGKYLAGNEDGYEPPDDSAEAERALQALLASPRAVRRDEIVDAVHELGELELVSLLGFDLGDEPVFVPVQKPAPKPPQQATAAVEANESQPLAVATGKPVLPDDSGEISLFWAALGVSGSLWVGGTWWWRRRRRRLLRQRANSAQTISDF